MRAFLHLDLTDEAHRIEIADDGDTVRLTVHGKWAGAHVTVNLPHGVAITDRRNPGAGDARPASTRRFEWAWAARPDGTPIPYDEESARDVADGGGVVLRRPVDIGPWEVAPDA